MVLATAIGASQANAQCSGNAGTCNTTHRVRHRWRAGQARHELGYHSLTNPTADQVDRWYSYRQFRSELHGQGKQKLDSEDQGQSAVAGFWDYAGSNSGQKPIGDLAWATTSGGTYSAYRERRQLCFGRELDERRGGSGLFRTSWLNDFTSASNAPGTYSLPIVFTLTRSVITCRILALASPARAGAERRGRVRATVLAFALPG